MWSADLSLPRSHPLIILLFVAIGTSTHSKVVRYVLLQEIVECIHIISMYPALLIHIKVAYVLLHAF